MMDIESKLIHRLKLLKKDPRYAGNELASSWNKAIDLAIEVSTQTVREGLLTALSGAGETKTEEISRAPGQPQLRACEADPRDGDRGESAVAPLSSEGTLKDYRPQHDDDCQRDQCAVCRMSRLACEYRHASEHKFQPLSCSCGLDALKAVRAEQAAEIQRLTKERDEARKVVLDTLWMAGRYADGRRSYAVGLYNAARAVALDGGYGDGALVAVDGMAPEHATLTERLESAEAALKAHGWQPIESAPKDVEFLGWYPYYATSKEGGSVFVTRWNEDKYSNKVRPYFEASGWVWGVRDLRAKQPTLWQPLPPAPVQTDQEGQ